ncbi:MAG TPA: Ig-like domain-containing protein, partial [Gemmatimonadales bacterium]|nr:Ig-like domain-containing protein [Gemmatimonadales bacterium]
MHKFYRSVLLTGMVAVGLAGCGDDVTVVEPPPPPPPPAPTVKSISVAPNPGSVAVGGTITMSAAVVADAGVATTVTWSSSDAAKATVNATSGVVTGVSAGSVAITATSTVNPAVQGNATVNVVAAPTATVTGVTVTPGTAGLVVGQTVQLSASVQGSNNPDQAVTWSSLSAGIASVSAGGLVTGVSNGTAVIRGCSTVVGFTNVCGSMSVTVTTPSPALVSIQSLTQGGLGTPVVLNNVQGQIEATVEVDGGGQTLDRVDVLIGGIVVASQSFSITPAPAEAGAEGVAVTVVLSFNTTQLRQVNGVFIPVIFNGQKLVTANLYVVGSATPLASNAIPVVMNNPDRAIAPASLNTAAGAPSIVFGGNTWFKSNLSTSLTYLSYSTIAPTSVTVTLNGACGTAAGTMSGTPTTGLLSNRTWTCANTEGSRSITGLGTVTYPAGSIGPDGSVLTAATSFSAVGGQFMVAGDARWNLITPTPNPLAGPVFVDNLGPTLTPNEIGFLAGCSATIPTPGCWVGANYNLLADFPWTDGGSGITLGLAGRTAFESNVTVTPVACTGTAFSVAASLEDPSPTRYNVCVVATDALGNSTTVFGFNAFGLDKTAPTITYSTNAGTLYAPNSTLAEATPAQVLNWAVNDNNAGLDTTVALTVALTNTVLNGTCATPIATALGPEPAPGAARFLLSGGFAPDRGCGTPGYYHYLATVRDRAGNAASDVATRIFGLETGVPSILALSPVPLYGGGTLSSLTV